MLELRDKVGRTFGNTITADAALGASAVPAGGAAQAIAALTSLGYTGSEAAAALAGLDTSLPTPELIRLALQGIGKGRR